MSKKMFKNKGWGHQRDTGASLKVPALDKAGTI
jgi:hypothetical protein